MRVAVLAVQGAFAEHETRIRGLGLDPVELRQRRDLEQKFDALILPGGESTVQGKLLRELGLFEPLKDRIKEGLPVLATCAGLILLAERLSNDGNIYFGTLPVTVKRNAYGRQLGSFYTTQELEGIGAVPMEFIRAPYIEAVRGSVKVLSRVDGNIVAVEYGRQLALAFHPELSPDDRIYRYFIDRLVKG